MDTRVATTQEQAERLAQWIVQMPLPFTMTVKDGELRGIPQNSLLHVWFDAISKHDGDKDPSEVKGAWHRKAGLGIRMRNPQFAWVWNNSAAHLDYEKQCKVLASGVFNVSSGMSRKELSEYMDKIYRDETSRGVTLTQPEGK